MKRIICLALLLALLAATPTLAEVAPNWYEVFVRSYQDSDGDGLGDLKGLTARLDYIEAMGWCGIWLMPIMPSPSYHKYDVTDYLAIDSEYGTLEDMKALVAACHARDIQLIVDMPINHTSTQHPWFQAACAALRAGDMDVPYVRYYNFRQSAEWGYVPLEGTDWFYEEQFAGGGMPDLNLDNPAVLAEFRAIFDFWLNEVGVDGFRLDAVTSYFTGDAQKNIACLRTIKDMAESLKPGSFLVGECWANLSTIAEYYASGIDSFFLFPASQAEGFIAASLHTRNIGAQRFAKGYQQVLDAIPEGLLTPFLCNHDTGRTVGLVQGRDNPAIAKFAEGALGMLGGAVFTYYGEEIGMVGSGDDPNKRLAMYWSDEDMTQQPPGATRVEYAYPSVDAQLADPDSLLNYVRGVNQARLAFPAISAGKNEFLLAEDSLCLMRRELGEDTCLIAMNFSRQAEGALPLPEGEIALDLEVGPDAARIETQDGVRTLVLPPYAIAILQ